MCVWGGGVVVVNESMNSKVMYQWHGPLPYKLSGLINTHHARVTEQHRATRLLAHKHTHTED